MSALNQPLFSKIFLLERKVTPIPMQTFSPLVLVKLDVIKVNLLEKSIPQYYLLKRIKCCRRFVV